MDDLDIATPEATSGVLFIACVIICWDNGFITDQQALDLSKMDRDRLCRIRQNLIDFITDAL